MNLEADESGAAPMASIVERNIGALLRERKEEEQSLSWSERTAQFISAFAGSMKFVFLHTLLYGAWIFVNLPSVPAFIPKFDPTFVVLAMFASVESIFLSTFILITQNRMMKLADRRADLNLQISLLSEHEVTRLVQMTAAISTRLGLSEGKSPDIAELSKDVRPEKVLETLEKRERQANIDT
jgi:uncharacterized membrane protein